jgi:RNA polymerase sigma-70 factor (ECF subfamily)
VEDGSVVGLGTSDGDRVPDASADTLPSRRSQTARVDHVAEEAALVAARAGHPADAVKILMRAYGRPITAFALRILRETEAASDVRQQVFLEAFQGLDRFKGHSSLWTWLCGITYHRCLDELRRQRRAGDVEDVDMLDRIVGQTDPAMDVEQVAERHALERCLAKLSGPMRSQLLMRCFLGLSYIEIADIVNAPHSTVQVRISRILPRLRRCLRGEGIVR